jgi:hypothetical protein
MPDSPLASLLEKCEVLYKSLADYKRLPSLPTLAQYDEALEQTRRALHEVALNSDELDQLTAEKLRELECVLSVPLALSLTLLHDVMTALRPVPANDSLPGPADLLTTLPALLFTSDLAERLGVPVGPLDSCLRRHRNNNRDCCQEVQNPQRNKPRIMWKTAMIMPVIQPYLEKWRQRAR